jgi:hypothetical protein
MVGGSGKSNGVLPNPSLDDDGSNDSVSILASLCPHRKVEMEEKHQ